MQFSLVRATIPSLTATCHLQNIVNHNILLLEIDRSSPALDEFQRRKMESLVNALNAMVTTTALLSSFLAAGAFIDPAVLRSGVPQGLFNSFCIFITALFLAIGSLIYVKMPMLPMNNDAINGLQKNSQSRRCIDTLRTIRWDGAYVKAAIALFFCGILLLGGTSVFLMQVMCQQFNTTLIPNCRVASIAVIVWFALFLFLGAVGFFIDYLRCNRKLYKLIISTAENGQA